MGLEGPRDRTVEAGKREWETCPNCKGRGQIDGKRCERCKGEGKLRPAARR
jgi:DnaJ-class molecular chaperone